MTDNWDQVRLLSLLEAFLDEDVLKDDHNYLGLEVMKNMIILA